MSARARPVVSDPRLLRSRAALRSALLSLLAEKPFEQILATELTARARVGYATFFRHYAAKEELLHDLAADLIAELLGRTCSVLSMADSGASTRALCRYVDERRAIWRTLLTGGAAASVRAEFVAQARDWARSEEAPEPTRWLPIDLGTVCSAGATFDALAWWLSEGAAIPAEEMGRYIERLIIRPFLDGPAETARGG